MPFSFQRVSSLFKHCSQGLAHAAQTAEAKDHLSLPLASPSPLVEPPEAALISNPSSASQLSRSGSLNHTLGHVAEVVSPDSPAFQEIRSLQAERFARASAPGPSAYLETVAVDPRSTIPVAIRRNDGLLVGTAILELPGATIIESVIRFKPGSLSARTLAKGTFAEMRGFATLPGTSQSEALDIIDAFGSLVVQIAASRGIEWLWFVPRRPLVSLLFYAQVPGLLPICRFSLCWDVLSWNEESPRLQQMRQLRLKEIDLSPDTLPIIYQIPPVVWAEDLAQRFALLDRRHQAQEFPQLLNVAVREAHKRVRAQLDFLTINGKHKEGTYETI